MNPVLSVVIPTHRRTEILLECLRRLDAQSIADRIEVIVVSDGKDDKTAAHFAKPAWRMPVTYREIEKSQQGVARNEGVKHARSDTVLFIGDDIYLQPDACEKHVSVHGSVRTPTAVLGYTTWDPEADITAVMRWLETSGWQFGYPALVPYSHTLVPENMQHRFTYTSHISVPRIVAERHAFRTDVHLYGWEDVEWGMRLKEDGVHLYYEPLAKALHHHHIELRDSLRRMETLGRSAKEIAASVPSFDRVPTGWKRAAYEVAALMPTMGGKHRQAFLRGLDAV